MRLAEICTTLATMPAASRSPRYQDIARRWGEAISRGTLAPGERFPSVRQLAADEGASVATILSAIGQLEDLGLVEARPRSGHFVKMAPAAPLPRPPPAPAARATASPVAVSALVTRVYHASHEPGVVSLAHAVPAPAFLPTTALARAMSSAVRRPGDGGVAYEFPPGLPELRRHIARRLVTEGCAVTEDDIIITSGASEAIHLALLAAARAGDAVAIETPAYHGTLQSLEALGLKVIEIPCHPETGMDLDALEDRLARHKLVAVLAVPSFSNPLGSSMPDAAKERLVKLVAAKGVPLLEDDVYGELAFGAARPRPAKAFDRDGDVVLCGSFSKTLAPGWRVGWAVPGKLYAKVEHLKFSSSVATATLPQRALARLLGGGGYERHVRALRAAVARSAARMAVAVADAFPAGTRVSRPQGGCFLWVELPPGTDSLVLFERALDAGVVIAPGPIFSPSGGHRGCIRLACAAPWEDKLDGAVRVLGRLAGRVGGS
jgi:DNA-binding transcriptional MocR family regulator